MSASGSRRERQKNRKKIQKSANQGLRCRNAGSYLTRNVTKEM